MVVSSIGNLWWSCCSYCRQWESLEGTQFNSLGQDCFICCVWCGAIHHGNWTCSSNQSSSQECKQKPSRYETYRGFPNCFYYVHTYIHTYICTTGKRHAWLHMCNQTQTYHIHHNWQSPHIFFQLEINLVITKLPPSKQWDK